MYQNTVDLYDNHTYPAAERLLWDRTDVFCRDRLILWKRMKRGLIPVGRAKRMMTSSKVKEGVWSFSNETIP